jgi:hypothetical protein
MGATFESFQNFLENPVEGLLGLRQRVNAADNDLTNPLILQAQQDAATRDFEAAKAQQGIAPGSLDNAFGVADTGFQLDTGQFGLLADERFTDQKTEIKTAINLMENPGTNQLGKNILQSILTNQASDDMSLSREENRIRELREGRDIAITNRAEDRANAITDRDIRVNAADERARLTRQGTEAERSRGNQVGKPPAGFQRIDTGQGLYDVPIPGSDPYAKRLAQVDAGLRSVDLLDDMLADFEEFGSDEMFNRTAIRKFDNKRSQMQADIFKLQGRGAPQAFEQELLDAQFPSISDFFTTNKEASYQQQRELSLRVLSDLANDPTLPADQRERIQKRLLTEQQKIEAQAESQGLTDG